MYMYIEFCTNVVNKNKYKVGQVVNIYLLNIKFMVQVIHDVHLIIIMVLNTCRWFYDTKMYMSRVLLL